MGHIVVILTCKPLEVYICTQKISRSGLTQEEEEEGRSGGRRRACLTCFLAFPKNIIQVICSVYAQMWNLSIFVLLRVYIRRMLIDTLCLDGRRPAMSLTRLWTHRSLSCHPLLFVYLTPEKWAWATRQRHGNMTPRWGGFHSSTHHLVGVGFSWQDSYYTGVCLSVRAVLFWGGWVYNSRF